MQKAANAADWTDARLRNGLGLQAQARPARALHCNPFPLERISQTN
jgi:hypothetical protein